MEPLRVSDGPPSLVGPQHLDQLIAYARATPPGCFVEVGVYKGGSAWHLQALADEQRRSLYLYDTFAGIPYEDPGDSHKVGDFSDTSYEDVRDRFPRAYVVQGEFPGSAVWMPPVAFAHLDCDQYRSVLEAGRYLASRMVPGGVMWFDDSPVIPAAHRAACALFGPDRLRLSADGGRHYVQF